jgi:hypothetical protein
VRPSPGGGPPSEPSSGPSDSDDSSGEEGGGPTDESDEDDWKAQTVDGTKIFANASKPALGQGKPTFETTTNSSNDIPKDSDALLCIKKVEKRPTSISLPRPLCEQFTPEWIVHLVLSSLSIKIEATKERRPTKLLEEAQRLLDSDSLAKFNSPVIRSGLSEFNVKQGKPWIKIVSAELRIVISLTEEIMDTLEARVITWRTHSEVRKRNMYDKIMDKYSPLRSIWQQNQGTWDTLRNVLTDNYRRENSVD